MRIEIRKYYILVYSNRLVRIAGSFVGLGRNAYAFAFWPILGIRESIKRDLQLEYGGDLVKELINHESIHLRQQLELLIIFAHILFFGEFLYAKYIKKMVTKDAYYWISMEQEAHRNATNFNYLNERKPYTLFKYFKNKKHLSRDNFGKLIEKDY